MTRSLDRVLPAEQGVIFWTPQALIRWGRSPLSFQKGQEGHRARVGAFYRTGGRPHVWVSGKTERCGLWGQKVPSPHFPRQSLRVLDSGPNKVTTSWNASAILFPAGLSFPICKMSRLDSGIFQTVHWGDLKISQNLSESLSCFQQSRLPLPFTPFPYLLLSVLQIGFSGKILFEKRVLRLKMFENLSGLFWLQQCTICLVMSDSSIPLSCFNVWGPLPMPSLIILFSSILFSESQNSELDDNDQTSLQKNTNRKQCMHIVKI